MCGFEKRIHVLRVAYVEGQFLAGRRVLAHGLHKIPVATLMRAHPAGRMIVQRHRQALFVEPLQEILRVWKKLAVP